MTAIPFEVLRLQAGNDERARRTFQVMADVFEEDFEQLSYSYLTGLLIRSEFWAYAAVANDAVVGGLTAHTLPMTLSEQPEVFLYDVAVCRQAQRHIVCRAAQPSGAWVVPWIKTMSIH